MTAEPDLAALAARLEQLHEKVDKVSATLGALFRLLAEMPATPRDRLRPKFTPAQLAEEHKRRTMKARIARAASRYGVSLEEWIKMFGPVDRLPAGAPRPAKIMPSER